MCRNCGYKLWPSSVMASAALRAGRVVDPEHRSEVSRFDMDFPVHIDDVVDFEARAHQLGIHLSPPTNWPFVICFGLLFLGLAAIPLASTTRIVLAVIGVLIFLLRVVRWGVVDGTKRFPTDAPLP